MTFEKTYLEFHSFMKHSLHLRQLHVDARTTTSVMTLLRGELLYSFAGGGFILRAGETVFLPRGAAYSYEAMDGECLCLQVFFSVCDASGRISLGSTPVRSDDGQLRALMERIVAQGSSAARTVNFQMTADVYSILAAFCDSGEDARRRWQVYPAVCRIEEMCTERLYVPELARLCSLSESRFRRRFRAETGFTPVGYKNELLIRRGCELLRYSDSTVAEISAVLGFANPYEFTRFFKKQMGLPPLRYRRETEGE